mmetsp:Transcript_9615/g.8279  ORF Transcript_9615/g.8279 Transcript_9615/m.8279 type:complete len:110 (+) Transcript_9615:187-516(+)
MYLVDGVGSENKYFRFKKNKPPTIGIVGVLPPSVGGAFSTKFSMRVEGFTDEATDLLEYSFGFYRDEEDAENEYNHIMIRNFDRNPDLVGKALPNPPDGLDFINYVMSI